MLLIIEDFPVLFPPKKNTDSNGRFHSDFLRILYITLNGFIKNFPIHFIHVFKNIAHLTPPLLFRFQYIDQDEGWSKIADSFKNVAYIKDWKANTNKYVCGYLDDSYYALQAQKAEHILERDDKKKELNYNQNFVSRITSTLTRIEDIESVEDVTTDIELLLAKAEPLLMLLFKGITELSSS